jgi:hypothetical protein
MFQCFPVFHDPGTRSKRRSKPAKEQTERERERERERESLVEQSFNVTTMNAIKLFDVVPVVMILSLVRDSVSLQLLQRT